MTPPDSRRGAPPVPASAGGRGSLVLLVLLVALTGAGLALTGTTTAAPVTRHRAEDLATPTARRLVCPSSSTRTTTYAGLLPGSQGSVTADGAALTIPPSGVAKVPTGGRAALTVAASGKATKGLFATRAQSSGGVVACSAPRASWWFIGVGASPGHYGDLELVNPRPGPAVVDVTVYGPDGPVDAAGLRGVTVQSGESKTLALADVAPATGDLAVHVLASRGLVVANVEDRVVDVVDPRAEPVSEWVPSQTVPSRHLALSGLPKPGPLSSGVTDLTTGSPSASASSGLPSGLPTAAPSTSAPPSTATSPASPSPTGTAPSVAQSGSGPTLVITNPGLTEAVAKVRLSGPKGTFSPSSIAAQSIPPESAVAVPLEAVLAEPGTTILVDGDRPLLAGYLEPGKADLVHAVPAVPWAGPAAVALPQQGRRTLFLTAEGGPESVTVTQYAASGERLSRAQVAVPAHSTVPTLLSGAAAAVVVTSADGRVVGAVLVVRASGSSSLPLTPVLASLRVPVVRPAG